MSKTNIENFNVTFNFVGPEHGDSEKKAVIYDPYTPIVLRKGVVSWTTKENLNKQLRSLTIGDKLLLQPIDREGEMDLVKSPMSFVVHEKCIEPEQSLLLISEDILFEYQMHETGINVNSFEETSLYKYLNTEFKSTLPKDIQDLLVGDIQVPTVGMVFGQRDDLDDEDIEDWSDDDWCAEYIGMDSHEQLPLMKQRMNRVAVDKDDDLRWWWLSNRVKGDCAVAYFAFVRYTGRPFYTAASNVRGVRPAFYIRCRS